MSVGGDISVALSLLVHVGNSLASLEGVLLLLLEVVFVVSWVDSVVLHALKDLVSGSPGGLAHGSLGSLVVVSSLESVSSFFSSLESSCSVVI